MTYIVKKESIESVNALKFSVAQNQLLRYNFLKLLKYKILIIVLLVQNLVFSQNYNYENLVFEGAGMRGIAYTGVIKQLEKENIISNIKMVGGTSIGAVTALMVSLGYTSDEIYKIISETDFQKFNDGKYFVIGGLVRLLNTYGWYRGDSFTKWIEKIIVDKTGDADITLKQLQDRGYKKVYVTATCLNKQKLLIISAENYPDMKVKDAMRISISIPGYYQAIFIDSIGNVYKKPIKGKDLDILVDGGIIGNYPIFMFDEVQKDSLNQPIRIPNKKTLGIRIDSDEQIEEDFNDKQLVSMEINNAADYILAFYTFVIEHLNRNQLTDSDWERTIPVSSVGVSAKVKRLSKNQKLKLVESGEKYTKDFFFKKER